MVAISVVGMMVAGSYVRCSLILGVDMGAKDVRGGVRFDGRLVSDVPVECSVACYVILSKSFHLYRAVFRLRWRVVLVYHASRFHCAVSLGLLCRAQKVESCMISSCHESLHSFLYLCPQDTLISYSLFICTCTCKCDAACAPPSDPAFVIDPLSPPSTSWAERLNKTQQLVSIKSTRCSDSVT